MGNDQKRIEIMNRSTTMPIEVGECEGGGIIVELVDVIGRSPATTIATDRDDAGGGMTRGDAIVGGEGAAGRTDVVSVDSVATMGSGNSTATEESASAPSSSGGDSVATAKAGNDGANDDGGRQGLRATTFAPGRCSDDDDDDAMSKNGDEGRYNVDEFEYSRCRQSPSFYSTAGITSNGRLDGTSDAAAMLPSMPDYHQMSKADRRELLRKLKRDLDDESMLSALGIKGDRNFDDDSDAPPSSTSDGWYYSYDDRSVFSDDGSTALYTEASTAFDTEASTAPLFSSTSSSRRDGKLARKDDGAIVYEYEPKVQRGCDLTDACMSLIMGDCNIEVEEVRTGFEHSDDMSVSMTLGKYNGANKIDNDRRGRPIVDVREVRDVLVDDIRTGGGSRGGRSSKQGLLVKDRLSSRRGENMSDDGLRTDVVPIDTSAIPVEGVCDDGDGKSMNDEVLVDDRSGDFFLIQGGCKVEIDDDMNQNDQQLVRSNDIIWLKVDDDIEEEIIVDSVGSDGLEGSPLSNSGGNSSNDEVKVDEGTERDNVRSNETSHHDNEEEMGDKVLPDDLGSSGSKGCHRSKSEGVRADEIISGMSSCFGDCELEVGEEYEHSIQGTRSDERSRHAGDEEMGEEILAEYVIRDGSEPSPTSTKESTFKRLFSSKRISKKSDERDSTPVTSVAASTAQDIGGGSTGSQESSRQSTTKRWSLSQRGGKKLDKGLKKAQQDNDVFAAVRPCIPEYGGILSDDIQNIGQDDSEMGHFGLEINDPEPLAALNVKVKYYEDDPSINIGPLDEFFASKSKASALHLDKLEGSNLSTEESDPASVAANLTCAASDNMKVDNVMDNLSLKIPTLHQLAALIWTRSEKDAATYEEKSDGVAYGDPELTTRKGVTLKERMALFGRSAQKSNDTDPTNVDANLSPAFVTATGTSSLKDSLLAVIPAQQVKEDSALTHVCPTVEEDYPCSPCDGVWDLKHEIIELSSYSVVQDDDVSYAITGADDINRLTSGIIIRSDVNATKQETSSTKQASFFARVGKTSQKSKATASTVKAKSSSRIKSTKTHKSTCESGVSGVTPKKKKLREYFDASSGRPYFSNVINATWGKPSNVDSPQRSSRTPIVSNTREFTIPVSTQPSMQEQLSQPKASEESPESKEKEQTTQSKNLKNVSLILKKKKAFSIDYPKETKSATCRSDGTVSTTDEVPAMSIREYPDHTQLQEKAMVLDDNISVSVSTFLIADDSTVDAIETAKSPAATTTTAKEEEREKTTTTTAKEEGEETMATKTRRWREYTDPSSGVKYYSDGVTSTWEKPTTFVPSNLSPTHPKKTVIF
jgi:hypothetical protein